MEFEKIKMQEDNMNVKNQEFVETECKKIIEQLIGLESE